MEDRRGERLSLDLIELSCGYASARVSPLGAEAVSWRVEDSELFWGRETSDWDRVAPVLFPCVGWSRNGRIIVDGQPYPMPVHGFAPSARFAPIERSQTSVTLELRASAASREHYPFNFRLRVGYVLEPSRLSITLEVENGDRRVMPYACGLHPGFAWPFAGGSKDDYLLQFSSDESPCVPVIGAGGLFSSQQRSIPIEGGKLHLAPALFTQEALCFLDARSRRVTFSGRGGAIEAEAIGFRHWALWSRPTAPFLCIEAWSGHGDPEGFSGEFRDKPSVDLLGPGETRRHGLSLRYACA